MMTPELFAEWRRQEEYHNHLYGEEQCPACIANEEEGDCALKTPRIYYILPDNTQECNGNTHVFPIDSTRCLCGRFVETQ